MDNGALLVRLFAECCAIYDRQKVAAVRSYRGIPQMLDRLCRSPLLLAVVTDACNSNAIVRPEKTGLSSYFSTVISPDISGAGKPNPASFLLALSELNVPAEQTVFVGDSIRRDIEPAQRISMITIHARYGDRYFSEKDKTCVPDFVASDVTEVPAIIERLV